MATEYPPAAGDIEYRDRMVAIAGRIPAAVLADLTRLHDERPGMCNAHSEGQYCCLDYMDPAIDLRRWAPDGMTQNS